MTKTRTAKRYAELINSCYNQIDGYAEMLTIATKYGMEYEIERIHRNMGEMRGEIDSLIDEAASYGYGPEDLWASAHKES